jgi:aspartyl protease family protein
LSVARLLAATSLTLAVVAASAQGVALAGRMGDRALLVIDGLPHTLAVGEQAAGVRLLRWNGELAEVEHAGARLALRLGGTPAQIGAAPAAAPAREIVITAGPGGHYTAGGAINGHAVQFMVDTGATLVVLGRADAERYGVDLRGARTAMTQTANGAVPTQLVTLSSVRVGEVELTNVGAAVIPLPVPYVLLGNSFLSRFQMRRDNEVMRLQPR